VRQPDATAGFLPQSGTKNWASYSDSINMGNFKNLVGRASPALPQTAPTLLLDIQIVVTGADPGLMYTAYLVKKALLHK
jgi:hypothetical protein